MKQSPSASEIDAAKAEMQRVRSEWLRREGVTAVDVGFKFRGGQMTRELAVRVHVRRKLPPELLSAGQQFPSHIGRFPVDVIEAEYAPSLDRVGHLRSSTDHEVTNEGQHHGKEDP